MATEGTLYLNLPVRNLERSKAFFTALGFEFDPRFEDARSACMRLSEGASVMLLTDDRFKEFTRRELIDRSRDTGGIFSIELPTRFDVDELTDKALELGGSYAMPPLDLGFMYNRSFYDPDGHHWEAFFMDEARFEAQREQPAPGP